VVKLVVDLGCEDQAIVKLRCDISKQLTLSS
jgi:hypothetical protein